MAAGKAEAAGNTLCILKADNEVLNFPDFYH